MSKTHIMIDFEGCGECPLALGAVIFNKNGPTIHQFYQKIDGEDAENLGLLPDMSTFYFWIKQSKEAQQELLKDRKILRNVLHSLFNWLNEMTGLGYYKNRFRNVELWAFGASYDFKMLENCFKVTDLNNPFSYRIHNDARTVLRQAGIELHELKRNKAIHHKAIDDCLFQIEHLVKNNLINFDL